MIAVDAMGGDLAPKAAVDGAFAAARQGVSVALFGDENQILHHLNACSSDWKDYPVKVVHTTQVVGMAEEAVAAIRSKKDSSLIRAVTSVRNGDCSAVISAGNSGALMAAALFVLGRQTDVERPAIAALLPAIGEPVLALDLGANADCKPAYLVQFARMGRDYAMRYLGKSNPRVALLSNGEEDGKGNALGKEVFELLHQEQHINFIGNIEPHDLILNKADVVVTDGFSGNVLLKTMEATATLAKVIYKKCAQTFLTRRTDASKEQMSFVAQLSEAVLEDIEKATQHSSGGVLLGVKGRVVVAHGGADDRSLTRAALALWNEVTND